jgi:M6 family metalloprotease-like protein
MKYVGDAIAAAEPTFDFSQTDVVYVVAAKTDLLPNSPTFRGKPGTFSADGFALGPAVTFGKDAYTNGRTIVPHETGHTLGLPELYAFDEAGPGDKHRFVGTWDPMGNVFTATDFFAWHRLKLRWLDPRQVVCVSRRHRKTVELAPIETPKNDDRSYSRKRRRKRLAKAVFVRTGSTTGLLVENRQRLGNDGSICKTGALVYTVDSSIKTGSAPSP